MSNEIDREASRVFAQDKLGRWLLHIPSGVVGKVGKVYAPGEYGTGQQPLTSLEGFRDMSGSLYGSVPGGYAISVAVLGFEDGNAFLADPENFQVLTDLDLGIVGTMVEGLRSLVTEVAKAAASQGAYPEAISTMIRAALQAQLRALTPR